MINFIHRYWMDKSSHYFILGRCKRKIMLVLLLKWSCVSEASSLIVWGSKLSLVWDIPTFCHALVSSLILLLLFFYKKHSLYLQQKFLENFLRSLLVSAKHILFSSVVRLDTVYLAASFMPSVTFKPPPQLDISDNWIYPYYEHFICILHGLKTIGDACIYCSI